MLVGYGENKAEPSAIKAWWEAQTTTTKVVLGVSAAAILVGGVYAILPTKPARAAAPAGPTAKATPNRSRKARRSRRSRRARAR